MRPKDQDPNSESGSRRAKMTYKIEKKHVLSAGCSLES
jgi:hypothetical protein